MTANLRPSSEISSLSAFGSAIYLFDETCHFVPKTGTKHFVPGFHVNGCKNFIPSKVHTGLSSSRSHVNTPLVQATEPPYSTVVNGVEFGIELRDTVEGENCGDPALLPFSIVVSTLGSTTN